METKYQLLLYLDSRRFLIVMKEACEKFLEEFNEKTVRKFPPCRCLVEIDVMDLLDSDAKLGDSLLTEPLKWHAVCNEILYACLQSINNDSIQIEPAQASVILRIKSVPRYLTSSNSHNYKGLVTIQGLLIEISKASSYVYHTVWSCPEECERNEVILRYIPKVRPKCYVCKSTLFENSRLRRCGEQVLATFQLKKSSFSKKFIITDDLISKLQPGSTYTVSAVVLKKSTVVWSVEEVFPLPAPLTCLEPMDIYELFNTCDGTPWKFIYCLASTIGINVCPQNCFMNLKINLLLSLASVKANQLTNSNILHVLVAGLDTGYVGELMREAANLADRSVTLGTTETVVSTALIASSGGVCALPFPLHIYNQKQLFTVLATLESGEISTNINKVKLKSAVWAQGINFKKFVLQNVVNVFGYECHGDLGEYCDDIENFILQNAIEPSDTTREEMQALKDVTTYIDLTAAIEVSLDNGTENLLRNYFLAARKMNPLAVPVGSMGALVTICLTSARLCRRRVANIDDAVFAIWLHISGKPDLGFSPDEYLQTPANIKTLEKNMNNFKDWLEQFISGVINML